MVDYKKKYLKYKKKYLAIKKLKGGSVLKGIRDSLDWSGLLQSTPRSISPSHQDDPIPPPHHDFAKIIDRLHELKKKENEKKQVEEDEKRRKHMLSITINDKIFKLYEVEGPTQFPERIGLCEGIELSPQKWHSLGSALATVVPWQYYFDRFIVVVNKNYDNVETILQDDDAERLIYLEDTGKTSHENIYSDHDAISMNINIPRDEMDYPIMKLITFNLEGFCWGNEGTPEEKWTNEYNEYRLNNVVSLIKPYIQPNGGNIFLFQEVVLKNATKFEEENKQSLTKFKIKLNIGDDSSPEVNPRYTLIHDGLTGAILYDNTVWELDEEIEILRHFVEKNKDINIRDNKKSNAYKLRHLPSGRWIIVVNIHLKAGLGPSVDETRKSELAYIYNIVKKKSNDFLIPVYFGGDWNSSEIDNLTLAELETIINNPRSEDYRIIDHLIEENCCDEDEEPTGLLG